MSVEPDHDVFVNAATKIAYISPKRLAQAFKPILYTWSGTEPKIGQCKWPVDVVGQTQQHFCCEPVVESDTNQFRNYCPHHAKINKRV